MTIYDIAKAAQVSIATVSRVLNNSSKVSEKTRQKVCAAMKELNYTPNLFARSLSLNSMNVIGIICADVSDSFYAKAVSLLENKLRAFNLDIFLSCTGLDDNNKEKYILDMKKKHVDAIILVGTPFNKENEIMQLHHVNKDIPIITINSDYKLNNAYTIICNEKKAIISVIDKLVQSTNFPILYLYGALTYSGQNKLKGYYEGLAKNNIPINPSLLQKLPKNFDVIDKTITDLLKQNIKFSSVICTEDFYAIAAQKSLLKHNFACPIIGFNNSILAECASPTITSIDNQLEQLCDKAIKIISQIKSDNTNLPLIRKNYTIEAKLIERESFTIKKNR